MTERFFALDGPGFLFRAYHALPSFTTSRGVPSQAVFGMSTMLWKLLREEQPDYFVVAWDPPGPTFREERFAAYKETRAPMPDDLRVQIPLVMRLFEALRLPVLEVPGFEADDVLGTLVDRTRALPVETALVTNDKDMLQLVGPRVRVLSPGPKGERVVYDEAAVKDKWGVEAGQIPDLLALMGDSIDNIPGVPGVGQKTAAKLIGQFGSVDKLYDNLTLVPGKLRETLAQHRKDALLSRELAVVSTRVPLPDGLDGYRRKDPDWAALRALWTELEFGTLIRQIPDQGAAEAGEEAPLLETAEALRDYLAHVPAGEALAVEWVGQGAPPAPEIGLVGLYHPEAGPARTGWGADVARVLLDALARPPHPDPLPFGAREGPRLIGHDVKALVEWWQTSPQASLSPPGRGQGEGAPSRAVPSMDDTAIAAYLLNSARPTYGLDEVCAERLGSGAGLARPGSRARAIWELWAQEARELDETGMRALYDEVERPLVPVLATMERHGIRVEPGRLTDFSKELERELDRLQREVHQLAGEEFNLGSPRQLAQILFEKLKLPPLRKTKTGFSTDADVLEQLALGHPLPARLLEHRSLAKLKSTYADTLPALIHPRTGRIHTTFNQMGAATGRLSSANPNVQNIPVRTELGRRIRAAFVAEPGHRLLAADYSQVELRILAHVSGEESLVEAFRRGEDIHRRTAAEVFGVDLAAVTPEQRDVAKTTNFSVIYGVTAFGLARGLAISQKEAQVFLDRFFARHPKVREYLQRTVREGRERGHVSTLRGRRRYLPELRSGNPNLRSFAERMATNAPVQGTAADLIKIAMVRVDRELAARGLRARMLLQVHDELLFEAPEAEVPALEALATEVMESAMTLDVPLKVDVKVGADWAQV